MSWADEIIEFAKFRDLIYNAEPMEYEVYDIKSTSVLYCVPDYPSIEDYVTQWGKNRKRIKVHIIRLACLCIFENDEVDKNTLYHLDMGARLFNAMKTAYENKWKFVKIIRIGNPRDKFDVQYHVSEYKLVKQAKITDQAKKNTKSK